MNEFDDLKRKYDELKIAFEQRKTLRFDTSDDVGAVGGYAFEACAVKAHHVESKVSFNLSSADRLDCVVKVNGVQKCAYRSVIGKNELFFDCKVQRGNNVFLVEFSDTTLVENLTVTVRGAVNKKDYGSRLSTIRFTNSYLTILFNGAKCVTKIEHHDGEEDYTIGNVTAPVCAAAKLDGSKFVLVYGDGNNMKAKIMSDTGDLLSAEMPFIANATNFSGAAPDGGATFYATEKGRIKKYVFDENLDLTVTSVSRSAKETFPSSFDADVYVVEGFDGRATLVTD